MRARLPDALAARADDRLDELVIGVLVAAAHQLGQRLRADRIDRRSRRRNRTDRPDCAPAGSRRSAGRAAAGRIDVAHDRRFRRLQVFAEAAASVEPRRAPAHAGPADSGAADTSTICSTSRSTSSSMQPIERAGPIAEAMRLAAPVAVGRESWIGVEVGGERDASAPPRPRPAGDRGRRRPDRTLRRAARPPSSLVARRTRSRRRASADQREHQVAARVDVVDDDQQLAEARLAEVLGQQLRVAAARSAGAGCFSCAAPRTRSHITRQQ